MACFGNLFGNLRKNDDLSIIRDVEYIEEKEKPIVKSEPITINNRRIHFEEKKHNTDPAKRTKKKDKNDTTKVIKFKEDTTPDTIFDKNLDYKVYKTSKATNINLLVSESTSAPEIKYHYHRI